MDILSKLEILGARAKHDVCSYPIFNKIENQDNRKDFPSGCCKLYLPNGKYINVLKVLFTNRCLHDCKYCFNSALSSRERINFESKELAHLFMNLFMKNYVSGLFLSSAVCKNSEETMEKMIETVEILRGPEYNFKGYIHLKVLPGAPYDSIKYGASLADRMSINCEAPNKSRFFELTSTKNFKSDILTRLSWLSGLKAKNNCLKSGFTTQFVVGASEESDKELLKMSNWLYTKLNLNRAYYSAFEPIANTALENHPPTSLTRAHRLYQTDWLLRIYGFNFSEIQLAFDENDNLPLIEDPKSIIAKQNSALFPLEINEASYEELIHVPGIGPSTAKKIINYRMLYGKIQKTNQLKNLGVNLNKTLPFIKIQGKYQKNLGNFTDFKMN